MIKYKRILLKLSGESLMGTSGYGIDSERLNEYAEQIKELQEAGAQVGIVIGGGNIFRGLSGVTSGFDRVKGDQMGMLATVINSLALQSALTNLNVKSIVYTAVRMEPVGELYSRDKVVDNLQSGTVAILSGGTGNPFFTTDTASALRAVEIGAEIILKGTRVDGVYTADPEKDPKATKFKHITFNEVIKRELNVMDQTAFTMCRENNVPIYVFDMNTTGNLLKVVQGEEIGTLVSR
jgi:uridylate kinase